MYRIFLLQCAVCSFTAEVDLCQHDTNTTRCSAHHLP
jgi:hypothetical protein